MRTPDRGLLHPALRDLSPGTTAERVYLDTMTALVESLRSPEEMAEAAAVLNPLLDARAEASDTSAYDEVAARILKYARGVRDARSGMACDLCLDYLRLGYDDARTLMGVERTP